MAVLAAGQIDDLREAIRTVSAAALGLTRSFDDACAHGIESGEHYDWRCELVLLACALRGVEADADAVREMSRALVATFNRVEAEEWAARAQGGAR